MSKDWDIIESRKRILYEPGLAEGLHELATLVAKSKADRFSVDEFPIGGTLVEAEVLKLEQGHYVFADKMIIALALYSYYCEKWAKGKKMSFKEQVDTLDRIEKELKSDQISRFWELTQMFWDIVVLTANEELNEDFVRVFNDKETVKDQDRLYFVSAYSRLTPILRISKEALFANVLCCILATDSEADYNLPKGEVLEGLREMAIRDEGKAKEMFHLAQSSIDPLAKQIMIPLIAGLHQNLGESFIDEILMPLAKRGEYVSQILLGVTASKKIDASLVKSYFELYEMFASDTSVVNELARVLFAVVKSEDSPDKAANVILAFGCIKDLLSLDDLQLAATVINEIAFLDEFEQPCLDVMLHFIGKEYFSAEKHLRMVGNSFWRKHSINYLKTILLAVSEKASYRNVAKKFSSAFHNYQNGELDQMVLGFLLDDRAYVRYLGRDILNISSHRFSFDLLASSPLQQYKFWVSMCQNLLEPKKYLPYVLHLLGSRSMTVRESLVAKLQVLSEDYGDHIVKLMEKNMDQSDPAKVELIERVRQYSNVYYELNVSLKFDVPELNPFYGHHEFFRDFNEKYHRQIRNSISEATGKNSFMSMLATNIHLGKGGGWKIGDKKDVAKLGSVSTSFVLPRQFFRYPEMYEMDGGIRQREDWDETTFIEIEKWIANEQ